MADTAIGVVTEALLTKVASLVAEEIKLALGVEEELKNLAQKLQQIQALLSDAQSKQITKEVVKLWLKKLQSIALDAQIVLDEFSYHVIRQKIECRKRDKVRNIFLRPKMARKIQGVLSSLDKLYADSDEIGLKPMEWINSLPPNLKVRSTVPYVEDSKIVGRDKDVSEVIKLLTASDSEYGVDLPVITILGMGGQGKTTVAQLVFKRDTVNSYFDKTVWVCVSEDFNVNRLLAKMHSPTITDYQSATPVDLVNRLKDQLRGKKYLLVLDDVWNENGGEWEYVRNCLLDIGGSKGSKILATTRGEKVALAMRTSRFHRLGTLSKKQSWKLFTKCAFAEGEATRTPQLVDIGRRILKRCGGVPLAIKIIGGLLYKNSESDWSMIERNEKWSTLERGVEVLSVIKLSYDRLPSLPLKQCFAYCAIFEKDTDMEKDKLIQLWMAQGLLNVPQGSNLQMEDLGNIYLNTLLTSSLLQDDHKCCRMHDLVHDVSVQVSENYCFLIKDSKAISNNEIEAVHVSIHSSWSERGMWKSLKGVLPSKLRTLYLKDVDLSEDLFENLQCLSVLIIENRNVVELPNSIGKLKHLRFLDVIGTGLRMLPKFLTKLYLLQTLRVDYLREVPKGFGNLINLRHIYFLSLGAKCVFIGLGQLTNLQTLPYFKVGKCKGCGIEELEYLDNLRGTLRIFCLQNVGSYASAAKSKLSRKSSIQNLELYWDNDQREENIDDSDVVEGLKPHSNVKRLRIEAYQSQKWPSWAVSENHLFLLRDLVELKLIKLNKCETLPSLGDLPFLEVLWIEELNNLKCIGKEFYGSKVTLFPALKRLGIRGLSSLVEWSDAIGITPTMQVQVFPSLEVMYVLSLPKLSVFPNLGTLPSLRALEIWFCKNITIVAPHGEWNRGLENEMSSTKKVEIGSDAQYYFPLLRSLWIDDCEKLSAPLCSLIPSCAPLERLGLLCNPGSWPKDLQHLTSLRDLTLGSLHPEDGDVEVDCLPWPYPTSHSSVSLTLISLSGFCLPKVTSIPHEIQQVATLRRLYIEGFDGLEDLPEWLGDLERLEELGLRYCKNLKQLPSVEAMQRLSNLKMLWIDGCPILQERCRKEISGSEWPKIAHIPQVSMDEDD